MSIFRFTGACCIVFIIVLIVSVLYAPSHARERQYSAYRASDYKNQELKPQQAPKYEIYEVTAYTADCESTGKTVGHVEYGITASGATVEEGRTIAAPSSIPFGTKIYIPYFNKVFSVEDRGSDIKSGRLDIYMSDREKAVEFGRQRLKVLIL